jgi:hypothetical protein
MDTTALLAAIKRRAYLADAGPQFTNAELLSFADEGSDEVIVPLVIQSGGIVRFQQTYTTPLVGGTARYQVPVGIGATLLDVHYVDTNSNIFRIALTDEGDRSFHSQLAGPIGPQTVYYFDGDSITLMPPPSAGAVGSLVITWPLQPSLLTTADQAAIITAQTAPGVFKCVLPFPAWLVGTPLIDVVASTSPHMTRVLAARVVSIVADVVTVTFQTTLANQGFGVNSGDTLMPTGQTIYPQVPKEAHPLLALEAARRAAMSMKDQQLEQNIAADVASKISRVTSLLSPLARKQQVHAVNRFSAFRSSRMRAPVRW